MDAHVLAPVARRRFSGPGAGDDQTTDAAHPLPEGAVDARVAGVGDSQLVAGHDQERHPGRVAERFGQGGQAALDEDVG